METRYHIGLLMGTLLILAILSYAYYADYNYRKEIARTEQTEQQETEQTVSTQGGAHKEEVYYLKNRNGYVIVYLDDQRNDADDQNAELKQVGISDHDITPLRCSGGGKEVSASSRRRGLPPTEYWQRQRISMRRGYYSTFCRIWQG